MAKKKETDDIDEAAECLLEDIAHDRQRLSGFLDQMLCFEDPHMAAEAIAKIADSLTKQNMLRIAALKAKIKKQQTTDDNDNSDLLDEIDRPFELEKDDQN